ncbi:23S rRNA (adenine(1618)-N(6))-methyltransferase RlmF [Colwellia sp. 1_MG-2023]|uniref:23S rRNA (adenine(1618)-N(6))-methyltransferase RlmF n=1 Tax=unclassified Colwellia TaxID=196834 RepID=UPI001C09A862|nr:MULTISPECIES: 23S rRNA (adenine(1618)-N(6))-methyltransferase RlmF [unclassified Colwellia]MBU2925779.1 23S rRNA (adenine(1618)-N(6))-methyltransferase RlmF [Colwellia sp. C2M11]MDO6650995.1 23S rRNA (adenine(1618)-N(6))-methyltransferase RlmF [Colwellia sp. 3_MG-2023]MDO6664030.1 23S rRNA (adenine(1618)-N(6))-methyltransferase RlmF [Colwellia sp. 2_MG-2023]MDO6688381.1 23S rRNA (adenine(1618)-N(6))-methyltransferase RlmF [Colwellia sp. 1_MG-2023]
MTIKTILHPRNKHRHGYDFATLKKVHTPLSAFIIKNPYNQQDTIDFSNTDAVKALNLALLKKHYQIDHWDFPQGYLCPPIPGRVDYIHYLADLLKESKALIAEKNKAISSKISVLDIGTGATCIYPMLGASEYNWSFVASDIDPVSIKAANANVNANPKIKQQINCRLQNNSTKIFEGIIKPNEFYHVTLCNPPFHKSLTDAATGTNRKWKNLNKGKTAGKKEHKVDTLNFGGQKAELWCQGGELAFIRQMIKESIVFQNQVLWFTCLVSNKDHLSKIKLSLKKAKASEIKVFNMAQGQKVSRFIAWRFVKNNLTTM